MMFTQQTLPWQGAIFGSALLRGVVSTNFPVSAQTVPGPGDGEPGVTLSSHDWANPAGCGERS
jgi:hypothetical protein